ncbi:unnamed protein product [Rotaria sp. Silwood2]|nr:unnamed protein product [Rotaria sp. Silwood2]
MSTDSSSLSVTNSILASPSSTNAPISTSPSSSSTTPKRILKPKRSLVWRYFNTINHDELHVECVLCSSIIIRKSTSTSNLLHHMQTQHNSEYQNINKSMKSKSQMPTTASTPRLPLSSERSVHLTKLIADFIIYNYLPLSIVESPQLQVIFQEAEPSYVIPKRKYFVNKIFQDMYSEIQQNVYNELQLAPGICLTTDIWTSQANQAYMTVTAHFVDLKNNKIKNFVLETKEFSGNHTAERIVERLNNICIDWSISDKIVCLVTDTCNTMRKVPMYSKVK